MILRDKGRQLDFANKTPVVGVAGPDFPPCNLLLLSRKYVRMGTVETDWLKYEPNTTPA